MRDDPALYGKLKGLATSQGTTLARCIKTGVDNKGHPMVKTIGACAGDAECYDVFSELFEPLVRKRFPKYSIESGHEKDMDPSKVSSELLDPVNQNVLYV